MAVQSTSEDTCFRVDVTNEKAQEAHGRGSFVKEKAEAATNPHARPSSSTTAQLDRSEASISIATALPTLTTLTTVTTTRLTILVPLCNNRDPVCVHARSHTPVRHLEELHGREAMVVLGIPP